MTKIFQIKDLVEMIADRLEYWDKFALINTICYSVYLGRQNALRNKIPNSMLNDLLAGCSVLSFVCVKCGRVDDSDGDGGTTGIPRCMECNVLVCGICDYNAEKDNIATTCDTCVIECKKCGSSSYNMYDCTKCGIYMCKKCDPEFNVFDDYAYYKRRWCTKCYYG
jgi:hypothetical protein